MPLSGFLYALLTVFVASCGARDQALVIGLGGVQGRRPLVLIVALAAAAGSCALAAWIGGRMLHELAPAARQLFGALALLLAGGEMLLLRPGKAPQEPTHSLFAAWLVIMGLQITDAARFLVLALAVGTASPAPAALGGALGSMAALALGWSAPALVAEPAMRLGRRVVGGVLLLIGLWIAVPNAVGMH